MGLAYVSIVAKTQSPAPKSEQICEWVGIAIFRASGFACVALATHDPGDWGGMMYPPNPEIVNNGPKVGEAFAWFMFLHFGIGSFLIAALTTVWGGAMFLRKNSSDPFFKFFGAATSVQRRHAGPLICCTIPPPHPLEFEAHLPSQEDFMRFARIALFVALASTSVFAQAAGGKVDQKDIDAAIDKGANWLANGGGMGAGDHFELVMYTLFHSGTFPRDDKRFLDGVKALQEKTLTKTYNTALTAMFLEAYDKVANQKRIAECAQFLVDNQCANGQWSYGESFPDIEKPRDTASGGATGGPRTGGTTTMQKIPLKRNRRGPPDGDHSNTQYAILGLRSCAVAEVIIPKETWKEAMMILEDAQDDKGGWAYSWKHGLPNGDEAKAAKKGGPKVVNGHNPSFGSMTAGCTGSCVICKYYLKAQWNEKVDFRKDDSVVDGMKWLADNFTIEFNAGCEKKGPESVPTGDKFTWHYYYLYALERAGMLTENEFFGRYEWYQLGARYLLAKQEADGKWKSGGAAGVMGGPDPVADTCFAILFLRRATKPVVPKTTSGR